MTKRYRMKSSTKCYICDNDYFDNFYNFDCFDVKVRDY